MGRWNTGQGLGAKEMIDTDKYETDNGSTLRIGLLRQDAELLFEEVKRLKTRLFHAEKYLCGIEWECYKDAIRFTLKEEITERMRRGD